MSEFTFENLFGEDMQLPATNAPKQKKESKPAKKAGKEKSKAKAGADFDVAIPCRILARGWQKSIDGTGTKKVSEIFQELYDEGYLEVKLSNVAAVYSGDMLFITTAASASAEDTAADFSNGAITVCDGQLHCEVTPEDFAGYDADEISASMLLDRWLEQNPEYKGCRIILENDIAYPVFSVAIPDTESLPASTLRFGDTELAITEGMTAAEVVKEHFGELPDVSVHLHYNLEKSLVFADFHAKHAVSVKKPFDVSKKADSKVEKKFKLPLHVRITTWNGEYDLTSEDFAGKEKVTIADIKEYFKPRYKIFSDSSRNLDTIYIEEENLLSLMFVSGKKGYYMVDALPVEHYGRHFLLRNKKELENALCLDTFQGNYVEGKQCMRVENLPHGIFLADWDSERGQIRSLSFKAKLPKMPASIMDSILAYFQADLSKEAWVKVCYNKASGEYFLVKGCADSVGKAYINFSMPADGIIDNKNIIQVMEVHSHNTMPAIFSATDDADELYPGLYAVIGRLDTDCPDVRIRAGLDGSFCDVPLDLVMEV